MDPVYFEVTQHLQKIFGTKDPTVPEASYALWESRNIVYTFSAVILPDYFEEALILKLICQC